ncbi:MAG TPA: hypothetical protein VI522_04795, partial [Gammaproteobacteria bacterium]|nr:hypothetical protein [Gammaproteobacteria bacterium]
GDWQVDGWTQVKTKDYQSIQGATITVAPKQAINPENNNAPQTNAPQTDATLTDPPKTDAPQTDATLTDPPKTDAPQTDTSKTDTQKPPALENVFVLEAETGQVGDKINGGEAAFLNINNVTFKNAELQGNIYAHGQTASIAAGDKLNVDGGHLNYTEKFDQQGDIHLQNGSLKTADLTLGEKSHSDFANAYINATKINMKEGHQVNTHTADVDSKDINREKGDWNNQGHTHVTTDHYTSALGATIVNKQSEKKEEPPAVDNKTETKPEEPVHQFYLNAKTGTIGDNVTGGDRTVLNVDAVEYDHAKLNGNIYSYSNTATIAAGSSLERNGGYSEYKAFTNNGHLSSKNHQQKGDTFKTNGTMQAENDIYDIKDNITLEKNVAVEDTAFLSNTIIDNSQLTHTGQAIFESKNYEHGGSITTQDKEGKKNVLFVKAEHATLKGTAKLDHAVYQVDHLQNASDFATGNGQYKDYQAKKSFELDTQDKITIDKQVRDCDLILSGSEINVNKEIKMDHDLSLTSKEKDITITKDIKVNAFHADSARDIKNNSDVQAKEDIHLRAKGELHNYGGRFKGRNTYARAKAILNIHEKSAKAAQFKGQKMGKFGVIEGENEVLLESTAGNIENHGGLIQSGVYTQLNSAGDVLNICNETQRRGKYDTEKSYHAAEIRGGTGSADTNGVGLHIEADGKVINDGSNFVSQGDNYISGKKGVEFVPRHHTYVSDRSSKRKWYGKKTTTESTSTVVQNSNVVSQNGRNIIYSETGNITGQATNFIAQGGTDVYAEQKNIKLTSLVTEDRSHKKTSHLWGISKNSRKESHQNATPTVFAGSGKTRLHAKGDVNCRGVVFVGDSDVHI